MLRNILKFGHNLQPKTYEKSLSKSLKTTNLGKAVRAPAFLRQAFMFAFDSKSVFWGIMLRRAKVCNSTKVLSLLFPQTSIILDDPTYIYVDQYILGLHTSM